MSKRGQAASISSSVATAHSLALLSEYTYTLDSLPLDLSRSFGDLRELDAVLSSSMASLTAKITQLTVMLENKAASKEERLWLLAAISEEANRLKLGGEDKIRVACHAADGLRGHKAHMKALIRQIPDKEFETVEMIGRKTNYPHVSPRATQAVGAGGEGSRRPRRGGYSSLSVSAGLDTSPNKRKRAAGRDDDPEVIGKTPRKERTGDASRQRNPARNKKERATSPTESLLSVASHLPPITQTSTANPRQNASGRANASGSNKRSRTNHNADAHTPTNDRVQLEAFNAPPTSSSNHPSLPVPYANGLHANGAHVLDGVIDWAHGQLEGPGMPVARSFVNTVITEQADDTGGANTEAEGEGDDGKTYCFCNGISYGDMIACDDPGCEREWFHLPCIGLTDPPEGTWYCEACRVKRNARRTSRGGKKRSAAARPNARNTSA